MMQKSMIKPNKAQLEALKSLKVSRSKGHKNNLVVLPTGIGKTILACLDTKGFKGRILYLAHRHHILEQAYNKFGEIHNLGKADMGFFMKGRKELNKKIIFATVGCLSIDKNLSKIPNNYFDYIIVDEYHHSAAETWKKILTYFRYKHLLGLTATPYRYDKKDIKELIDNTPVEKDMSYGIKEGLLSTFIYEGVYDDVDYSKIQWNGYKYRENDLNKTLIIKKRDEAILKEYKTRLNNRKTLGFCVSVKHVKRCVELFNKNGIPSEGITHTTDFEERRRIVDDFRLGKIKVIFTRDIFNEGVDIPEVTGIMFLRPTFSRTVWMQQIGRGLRIHPGKKDVRIIDFIGNYHNAHHIQDWLEDMVKKIKPQGSFAKPGKPLYHYNVPRVHFERKVLDIFENQRPIMDQDLIDNYNDVKKKLGFIPDRIQLEEHGKYSIMAYRIRWGNVGKFKKLMKDDIPSKEEYVRIYNMIKKKLGKPPRYMEMKANLPNRCYSTKDIIKYWGSWTKFKIKMDPNNHLLSRLKKPLGGIIESRRIKK